ncbi:MAG: bifunctional molybdenum cofactor biosynthesis protein MoaC/MoaB [Robiginitomaculum sp.]|nr:bifunctional molybdenum cofactor biosynthesis protein MoaC/MoaB [Robiginitomaculum sp.]
MSELFGKSAFHMADVGGKTPSNRRALAMGRVFVGQHAFAHIAAGTLPKGDVLKIAEIAGISGAKKTSDIIPLCHPLPLEHVAIRLVLEPDTHSVAVYALVACFDKTGVEMEALSAVSASLLTLYDLTKPVEPALTISDISLLLKEGGKKGRWVRPEGLPDAVAEFAKTPAAKPLQGVNCAVITLSDRASDGTYKDLSGPTLAEKLTDMGAIIISQKVLPDDQQQLEKNLTDLCSGQTVELIMTTGGTGLTARDITPEAISAVIEKPAPGFGEVLRSASARTISTAWLSRSIAGVCQQTLIVSLPGSPKAIGECLQIMSPFIGHAVRLASGKSHLGGGSR